MSLECGFCERDLRSGHAPDCNRPRVKKPKTPKRGRPAKVQPSLREQLAAAQAEVVKLKKMSRCPREPDRTTLGGIIQTSREEAGMTLREAAKKAGMAPSILSRIERDAIGANPTLTNLRRITAVICKPLSKLFAEWEDQKRKSEPIKTHGKSKKKNK